MDETGIVLKVEDYQLGNSRLDKATRYIVKSLIEDAKNEKGRAIKVHDVEFNGDAVKHDYTSTADWAEQNFRWHKSKTSRYIRIVDRFHDAKDAAAVNENGQPLKPVDANGVEIWEAYTVSQMVELLKATDEQLKRINNRMSVREIRDFIENDNKLINVPDGNNPDEQNNPNEQNNPEPNTPDNVKHYTDITVMLSVIKEAATHGERVVIETINSPMGNAWAVTFG